MFIDQVLRLLGGLFGRQRIKGSTIGLLGIPREAESAGSVFAVVGCAAKEIGQGSKRKWVRQVATKGVAAAKICKRVTGEPARKVDARKRGFEELKRERQEQRGLCGRGVFRRKRGKRTKK